MVKWFGLLGGKNKPSHLPSASGQGSLARFPGFWGVGWGPQLQLIFPLQPDGARDGEEAQKEEASPEFVHGDRAG